MADLFVVALVAACCLGIVMGTWLTTERHDRIESERQAEEERLAYLEQLYAAWAALRDRDRPPGG